MRPAAGSSFGPYEVRSLLGAGGMGEVYRARDRRLNRDVALKILPHSLTSDELRRKRFAQEAQAASALNHPHIVAVYDVNFDTEPNYIVSELVEGNTLRNVLGGRSLPLRKLLDIAVQIADGLAAAHQAGIVHRDMKPSNILMTRDGRVKIADFGLAKQVQTAHPSPGQETAQLTLTDTGSVMGTVEYMSPEQACGEPVDTRSDIFSFGVILHEMAEGRRPFERKSKVETLAAIINMDPPPPNEDLPPSLKRTIRRCLAKSPDERYQSTRDLFLDLREQRDAADSGVQSDRAAVQPRMRQLVPALPAVLVLSAVLGLILALFLTRPVPAPLRADQFHPLVTGPEDETNSAWSPDGRSIAYQANVNGIYQIFTKGLDSETPQQLTHTQSDAEKPAWSGDGSRVYFLMNRAVWDIGTAGGDPRMILDAADVFAISPDGKSLALARKEFELKRYSIYLSTPPGAAAVRYTPTPFESVAFNEARLAFSPDSTRLLLWVSMVGIGRPSEFWMLPLPLHSGTPRLVLPALKDAFPVRGVSWLPGGRRLVVSCTQAPEVDRAHLYIADPEKNTVRPLLVGIGAEENPAASPDGKLLAYTAVDLNTDIVELPLDGSPVRPLLASNRNESSPSWFRRGRQLAYITDRRGVHELWITNLDHGWDKPLVTPKSFPDGASKIMDSPVFSPDGEHVAFHRGGRLWIVAAAGGTPVRLTNLNELELVPTWSPDGSSIVYLSDNGRLLKARVGGTEPPRLIRKIVTPGCANCTPDWSPTGQWIAYASFDETMLTSPDGSNERVIYKPGLVATAWSEDGATLYGITPRPNQSLIAINIATGKETLILKISQQMRIGTLRAPSLSLSLSPDGKSLATTAIRRSGDIWMLDNFEHRSGGLLARFGLGSE